MVDQLIKDIIEIIENHWLIPEWAIEIWLVAQDLCLNLLRDISLAVCLDRFEELSVDKLLCLTKYEFIKLIGNVNLRARKCYLWDLRQMWMDFNKVSVLCMTIFLFFSIEIILSC